MTGTNNSVFTRETSQYRDYLLNYATKLTHDRDDAEDLVQETYLRAYRFFDSYQVGTNCKSWLFKIMKNLFLNYRREKKKEETRNVNFEDYEFMFYYEPKSLENQISEYLILSVNHIKDDYRTLIILFYFENYSLNDISEFLNWPLGTVKSRLHRARAELRNLLKK